ncbi:MAG: phytoene desaturase family protein, partial [Bacteroidales bacterium]
MKQKAGVIGSGIAGISSAIRLAVKGYAVEVFEQADKPGGKLSQLQQQGFRFDTGPSLFTMPDLVTELFSLAGENPENYFRYRLLESSCRYFWEDGTVVNAWKEPEQFAAELSAKTNVEKNR